MRAFATSFLLVVVALSWEPVVIESKAGEWDQQCNGNECGYNGNRGNSKTCFDQHETCRDFALWGECKANPAWMSENCRKSCGLCPLEKIEDEECKDLHSSCPQWSGELECFTNPAFMSRACPKSCWLCFNGTDLREDGIEEEEIGKRLRFSQTDFGLWQALPETKETQVRAEVQRMGRYVKALEKTGPGTLCNNLYHDCAAWVFEKRCEKETDFMMVHCSLACQYCDIVDDYHACRRKNDQRTPKSIGDLTATRMQLSNERSARDLHLSDSDNVGPGEWILELGREAIWKDAATDVSTLLEFLKLENSAFEWKNVSLEMPVSGVPSPDRSGSVALCNKRCQRSNPALESLASGIATLLQIDPPHIQPLEFVHYKRGERYASHHDYNVHDSWKHSGNRLLTVFIVLQNPEKGGSVGFPEMNWLMIEDPRILIWPNVNQKAATVPLKRLKSEQLPVVEGELYGVYATIREYPFDDSNPCA